MVSAGFNSNDSSGTNATRYILESGGYEPQGDLARYLALLVGQNKVQADDLYGGMGNAKQFGTGFFGYNPFPKQKPGGGGGKASGAPALDPGAGGGTFGGTLDPTEPNPTPTPKPNPTPVPPPIEPPSGPGGGGGGAGWTPEGGSTAGPPGTNPPRSGKPIEQLPYAENSTEALMNLWNDARRSRGY